MIVLERAGDENLSYAWELYRSSIEPLATAIGCWSESEERRVVQQSFEAEEARLIVAEGRRIGWMHVRTTGASLELWQLFVSPAHRGQGVGATVLRQLQTQATRLGLPILLSVLRNNRAMGLYERLGFSVHAEGPHHLFLWWSPRLE